MRLNLSFIGWTLLVVALAGAAFLLVWNQLEDPQPARVRTLAVEEKPAPKSERQLGEPLSARVLFAFDRAALESAESAKLAQLAEEIEGVAFERLDAVGHADRIGTEAYNLDLSQRRADVVKAYLVSRGIDPGAVRTYAKGKAEPVTGDGCTDMGPETRENRGLVECLQPDRRVAVAVVPRR